ncbi:MAG: hypothetical protein JSS18_10075 [Proteobacteria bacterium]|nr:hypothetical protein [Pseudomonadota bacterium]
MASPVDTSVKHFYSAMSGAPVLSGQAGAMIGLLDACLVTGFDLKSATSLTVAGGVATLAFAGSHSAVVDAVVLVDGVTGALAGLNGEQKVTAIAAGVVRFATALPDGTAAGSISFKMAPAGWAKVYSGTNLAAYQSPHMQSTKMFVRVDDTGTMSCRLRGYEAMSDINTGAGLFPLDSQLNGGGWMSKSAAANATRVNWRIVADARGAYISVVGYSVHDANASAGRTVCVGDFRAYRPGGDPYAFVLGCGTSDYFGEAPGVCDQDGSTYCFAARSYSELGASVGLASRPEIGAPITSGADNSFGTFPSVIDGGLRLSRRLVMEGITPRGVFPGLYTVPQSGVGLSIAPLTVQPGAGPLAGRNLLAIGCGANSQSYPSTGLGISFIDITGPWER